MGLKLGIGITLFALVAVILLPFMTGKIPSHMNEWGDYLTGFLSPIALAWFVATLMLQKKELELQREEFKQSREAQQEQGKQQERAANAYLEANKLMASNLFIGQVEQYYKLFETYLLTAFKSFPTKFTTEHIKNLSIGYPRTAQDLDNYIKTLEGHDIIFSEISFNEKALKSLTDFRVAYAEFKQKAENTGNKVYDLGNFHDAYTHIVNIRAFNED